MAPALTIRPGHPDFLLRPPLGALARRVACPPPDRPAEGHQPPRGALPLVPGRDLRREGAATDTGLQRLHGAPLCPDGRGSGRARGRARRGPVGRSGRGALRGLLVTAYEHFSFSYRELLIGPGFGARRNQMLDAFANLLVQLHLVQCFWGDCNLSKRPLPLRRGGDRDGHGRRRDRRGLPGRPHWRQATLL